MHAANLISSHDVWWQLLGNAYDLCDTHMNCSVYAGLLPAYGHLDNSVQSTQQARNTHLACLVNLRLWNLLVAGLSWDCWGHDSGECYSYKRKPASCFVSGAHSQEANHLYTGKEKVTCFVYLFLVQIYFLFKVYFL